MKNAVVGYLWGTATGIIAEHMGSMFSRDPWSQWLKRVDTKSRREVRGIWSEENIADMEKWTSPPPSSSSWGGNGQGKIYEVKLTELSDQFNRESEEKERAEGISFWFEWMLKVCYLLKMNAEKQLGLWIMVREKSWDEFIFWHINLLVSYLWNNQVGWIAGHWIMHLESMSKFLAKI